MAKDKDNCGVTDADIERGFLEVEPPVPPKEIKTPFGKMTNYDRMEFDDDTGEMKDRYRGGFVKRGIDDNDNDD